MNPLTWQRKNKDLIQQRLERFRDVPDGILYDRRSKFHRSVVMKQGRQIKLFFVDPLSTSGKPKKSGFMSRIDIADPLKLVAVYTQAMMLSLLWLPEPRSISMLGFGGGRLAMLLHHSFPEIILDCVELDPEVLDISEIYFGINLDERLKVIIQDGREYLETLPESKKYDIFFVDCFTGPGYHPPKLATRDFYHHCKEHLSDDGVLVTNILRSDPLFQAKAETFKASFSSVRHFYHRDADVFFGLNEDCLTNKELKSNAEGIQKSLDLAFPYAELLKNLLILSNNEVPNGSKILTDESLMHHSQT